MKYEKLNYNFFNNKNKLKYKNYMINIFSFKKTIH